MNTMTRVISLCALLMLTGNVLGASKINTLEKKGLFGSYEDSGVAIRGFDTVAYFTQGKAVEGVEEFSVDWSGATWLFSTQEHADLFEGSPEQYAPQYGGYCAYGVSQDYLVKIEGDQWKIEDDKLYLNYDKKVQKTWLEDIPGYIESANDKISNLLGSE